MLPADATSASGPPGSPGQVARPGRRLVLAGTVLAWLSLVLLLAAVVFALVPVTNPRPEVDKTATAAKQKATGDSSVYVFHDGSATLDDCGVPAAFVLTGRLQGHYGGGKTDLEKAREAYANRHSCSDRVAGRLVPAGVLLLAMLLTTAVAFTLTILGRSRARKAWAAANPPPADPPLVGAGGPPGGAPTAR